MVLLWETVITAKKHLTVVMYEHCKRHFYNEAFRKHLSLILASKFMIRRLLKKEEMSTNLFQVGDDLFNLCLLYFHVCCS